MNYRIFFTLFPRWYWVLIAVGILFKFITDLSQLGNVLINFGSFLVAFKAAVIIHEVGHLLAAKAVGGIPTRMVLGRGHELYRTKIFNIRIVINSSFLGGYAYASFDQPKFLKLRYGFYILGGVLLNVLVAVLLFSFFDLKFRNPRDEVSIALPFVIFLANAIMVINFVPYYATVLGMKVPTDGLALLKLPFAKRKEITKQLDTNLLFEGHEYLEKKDYQSAWNIFADYLSKYPDSKILSLNFAYILLKTGQPEKSIEECRKLLDSIDEAQVKPYTALIHNQLAWSYLVSNDIEQADYFSALAIKRARNENHIRGTRGAVLVEKEMTTEGMKLLFHSMDFQFVNNDTLSAAIYLMLAYHIKGEVKQSGKYFKFVKDNEHKLEADEKVVFERSLSKMHAKKKLVN
jgi:tetratricopeptide (TPR) repeat protein